MQGNCTWRTWFDVINQKWSITVVRKMDDLNGVRARKKHVRGIITQPLNPAMSWHTFPPTCTPSLESIPLTRSDAPHNANIWLRLRSCTAPDNDSRMHWNSDWQCMIKRVKVSNKLYPPVLMIAPPVRHAASPAARKRIRTDTNAWGLDGWEACCAVQRHRLKVFSIHACFMRAAKNMINMMDAFVQVIYYVK